MNGNTRAPAQIALIDLLDRVLVTGVAVDAELTLSIADVDLVTISLQALLSSVRAGGHRHDSDPRLAS
ncbi:gas vesicle protein [Micromonospora sp. CPCC 206061]|uniref:gas vesicle protein n=1 Tax=Micromonospora sp. CPCC 206061 TaxID=3122410 RepID=UPI002FF18DEA